MPMDKRIIIEHQFLPTITWMALAAQHDELFIDSAENYNKRTFRNKAMLIQPEEELTLSVPLRKGKHDGQNMQSVEIAYAEAWAIQHLRSIQSLYGKSPYFMHYIPDLTDLYSEEPDTLFELNTLMMEWLIEALELETDVYVQEDFVKHSDDFHDVYRDSIAIKGDFSELEDRVAQGIERMSPFVHLPFVPSPRHSILSILFHLGPETRLYLRDIWDEPFV